MQIFLPGGQAAADVALGFIAFSIGNEFRLEDLKKIGKQATVIGIFQAVFTTVIVDIALISLHFAIPDILPLPVAIVLGAIINADIIWEAADFAIGAMTVINVTVICLMSREVKKETLEYFNLDHKSISQESK